MEFDWLAVDAAGAVALLSTAGGGYAPKELAHHTEDYDSAIDAILALPARTEARCFRELGADLTNTWKLVAQRGVYAYDSDPLGGAYRIIAAPNAPIRLSDLPAAVAEVAGRIVLRRLHFEANAELKESDLAS